MTLDKTHVARRQLGVALALFLEDLDPIVVHVLACTAGEVAEYLAVKASGQPFSARALATFRNSCWRDIRRVRNQFWSSFRHATTHDLDEEGYNTLMSGFSDLQNDWQKIADRGAGVPILVLCSLSRTVGHARHQRRILYRANISFGPFRGKEAELLKLHQAFVEQHLDLNPRAKSDDFLFEQAGPHNRQPIQFSAHGFRALGFKYEGDRKGLELDVPFAQASLSISRPNRLLFLQKQWLEFIVSMAFRRRKQDKILHGIILSFCCTRRASDWSRDDGILAGFAARPPISARRKFGSEAELVRRNALERHRALSGGNGSAAVMTTCNWRSESAIMPPLIGDLRARSCRHWLVEMLSRPR
jgi:hypothetical protein